MPLPPEFNQAVGKKKPPILPFSFCYENIKNQLK